MSRERRVSYATTPAVTINEHNSMIMGLEVLSLPNMVAVPHYSGPVVEGVYGTMFRQTDAWDFTTIMNNGDTTGHLPRIDIPSIYGYIRCVDSTGAGTGPGIVGWDNGMESLVACISSSSDTTSIAVDFTLSVEFTPGPNGITALLCRPSAGFDPSALRMYQIAAKQLPIGVPADQNAGFWSEFLRALSTAGVSLSRLIPGRGGAAFRGAFRGLNSFGQSLLDE
jgi:hypothetical protein